MNDHFLPSVRKEDVIYIVRVIMGKKVRYCLFTSGICFLLIVSLPAWGQDIDFGDVQLGSYKDSTATIQNPLPIPVSVTASYMKNNPSDYSIIAGGAPFTVPPGGTHYMGLRFKPSALGIRTDSLVLEGPYPGSPFYVGLRGRGVPVPVELAAFTATSTNNGIVLRWTTASETNNYGFEIQRRNNENEMFKTIGFLRGHGTSVDEQRYSFLDRDPLLYPRGYGIVTYRLKQVDFDGTSSFFYAPSVHVDRLVNSAEAFTVQAFPNPFRSSLRIIVRNSETVDEPIRVQLYDAIGRRIAGSDIPRPSGGRKLSFSLDNTLFQFPGTYFVRLTGASGSKTIRVLRVER